MGDKINFVEVVALKNVVNKSRDSCPGIQDDRHRIGQKAGSGRRDPLFLIQEEVGGTSRILGEHDGSPCTVDQVALLQYQQIPADRGRCYLESLGQLFDGQTFFME